MNKGVIIGLVMMVVFFGTMGYFIFINDPTVVSKIDTGNPRTNMEITNHTRTGQLDYWYQVIDGVGNIQTP